MASTAFDFPDAEAAARPPLSTHPAFPAVVALWFAALLGLGSLVLPAALFERLFGAVGLNALVPLGLVTRIAIAFAGAGGGALAGLAIARRVVGGPARLADDEGVAPAREAPRRPLNVREDLDDLDEAPVMRRRARSLLPVEPEPVSLAADEPAAETAADFAPPAERAAPATPEEGDYPMAEHEVPEPWLDRPAFAEVDDLVDDAPEPFASDPEPAAFGAAAAEEPAVNDPFRSDSFRSDWASVAPDRLGLVQLVERLGASFERRRQWRAEAEAAAASAPEPERTAPAPFEAAPADEAAQAMAAYFGRSFAPPKDHGFDDGADEGGDDLAAFSLPLARPAALEPFLPEDAGLDEEDEGEDGSFGSLLAMRGPFAVRDGDPGADEEPFADAATRAFDPPFGTAAPRDEPAAQRIETDAQLREALAALQRVRGAA